MARDASAVRRLFDGLAQGYGERYPGPTEQLEAFAAAIPAGSSVLDVGCGPGGDVAWLAARGFDAWGIDLSPRMLDEARRRHPGARVELGDVRELEVAPGSLGGVVASFSLIFLPAQEFVPALGRVRRWLRPDGRLLLVVQEADRASEGRPRVFTHASLLRALSEAGFVVESDRVREPRPHEMPTRKRSVIARPAQG